MIMKKILKGIVISACLLSTTSIFAAPAIRGMAVYRDGVIGTNNYLANWHGGVFADYDINSSNRPIVHIAGTGKQVDFVDYDSFVGKNTFQGVYWHTETSSSGRRSIANTAYELVGEDIDYNFLTMVQPYDTSKTTGYITPSDIKKIRCDGVVEYCFEWAGYDVRDFSGHWDISAYKSNNAHNKKWASSGPEEQADELTRIYKKVY